MSKQCNFLRPVCVISENNINHIDMKKLLRRSSTDSMIAGVCGGIAEYFDIDPVAVRVAYVLLTFFTVFSSLLAYIALWIVIPRR